MMVRRGKDINVDEEGLWALVSAEITPLKGRKAPTHTQSESQAEKTAPRTSTKAVEKRPVARATAPQSCTAPKARDLDRRTDQKLTRGQMEIDATIDLHGYGQAAARDALLRFLEVGYGRGYRCILVITGKGRMGGGVLRTRLPEWIDEAPFSQFVLKAVQARQADGGGGAYYILLRRRRD